MNLLFNFRKAIFCTGNQLTDFADFKLRIANWVKFWDISRPADAAQNKSYLGYMSNECNDFNFFAARTVILNFTGRLG